MRPTVGRWRRYSRPAACMAPKSTLSHRPNGMRKGRSLARVLQWAVAGCSPGRVLLGVTNELGAWPLRLLRCLPAHALEQVLCRRGGAQLVQSTARKWVTGLAGRVQLGGRLLGDTIRLGCRNGGGCCCCVRSAALEGRAGKAVADTDLRRIPGAGASERPRNPRPEVPQMPTQLYRQGWPRKRAPSRPQWTWQSRIFFASRSACSGREQIAVQGGTPPCGGQMPRNQAGTGGNGARIR